MDTRSDMSPGRIHYVIGAYFIGVGTLFLLALVGIIPAGPSEFSVGTGMLALSVGMIPFGIYYILTVRRKRGFLEASSG